MKKIILLSLVAMLVLGAAAYVYAASSAKIVDNGPHNIQVQMGLGSSEEICAYCHTPHNANIMGGLVPLGNINAANATAFCDTCHDGGAVAAGDFKNGGTGVALTGWASGAIDDRAEITNHILTGVDHVVNTLYPSNADFKALADANTALTYDVTTVHCTSCHNVHNNADGLAPFLRISNANSALCTSCHNR